MTIQRIKSNAESGEDEEDDRDDSASESPGVDDDERGSADLTQGEKTYSRKRSLPFSTSKIRQTARRLCGLSLCLY